MLARRLLFGGVLVLLAVLAVFWSMGYLGSRESVAVPALILIVAGTWILLRKVVLGEGKAAAPPAVGPVGSPPGYGASAQAVGVPGAQARVPKMRREKNFIVEENLDAVQWPQECSWCGGPVEHLETLRLKEKFKSVGQIQAEVAGIPYCLRCAGRARWTGRLNTVVVIIAFVIGIPLAVFAIGQVLTGRSNTNIISWGWAFVVCIAIGYGIAWLVVKLPFKLVLGKRLVESVGAGLFEEKKSDGRKGVSAAISIPRKAYADKFAQVNMAPATAVPVRQAAPNAAGTIPPPAVAPPAPAARAQAARRMVGIDWLLECTRDDLMDITNQWTQAVDDLQQHGEEGSRALAELLAEMLRCRADKIHTAILMSHNLLPTQELIAVLNEIRTAPPVTPAVAGARFQPQIAGGGMIGWTDGTAKGIQTAASTALGIVLAPPVPRPDLDKLRSERDVPGLIGALSYRTDMRVRAAAAEALGEIGDARAAGPLTAALQDGVLPVRTAAVRALNKIGDGQAV